MRHLCVAATAAALAGVLSIGAASAGSIVNAPDMEQRVAIVAQPLNDGALSTAIVNRGTTIIEHVDLVLRYDWVWNDDRAPVAIGASPGWVEFVTLDHDIEPGTALPFHYIPPRPLVARDDGYFVTRAAVVGLATAGQ